MNTTTAAASPLHGREAVRALARPLDRPWIEYLLYAAFLILTVALSDHRQAPLSLHAGKGWDGEHYYAMADQFARGQAIQEEAPFCYRVGTPILAALISKDDLLHGFKVANLLANLLTFVFFVALIRRFIPVPVVRVVLVLLLLTHWIGPFRFTSYYPASNDNFYHAFVLLGLLAIELSKTRPVAAAVLLSLSTGLGVFFRETVLLVALAFPFAFNPLHFERLPGLFRNRLRDAVTLPPLFTLAPLVVGVGSLLYIHFVLASANGTYSFVTAIYQWAYEKPFPTFIQGAFVIFGPALVLIVFNGRRSIAFLHQHQHLLAFLGLSIVLTYVGGNDTERYWYGMSAVVYLLVGRALIDLAPLLRSWSLALVLVFAQAMCHRLFWTLPDYPSDSATPFPLLTIASNAFQYLDLYSFHGARRIEVIVLLEYAALSAVLFGWLFYRARKIPRGTAMDATQRQTIEIQPAI